MNSDTSSCEAAHGVTRAALDKLAFIATTLSTKGIEAGVLLELICDLRQAKWLGRWFRNRGYGLRVASGEACEMQGRRGVRNSVAVFYQLSKFKELKGYPILGRLATPPSTKVISRAELLERGTGTCAPSPGRCCAEHLIGVRGNVYDVGYGGVGFYGAGCSYHLFCGKDASRALAKMSFKPEDVDRGWPDLGDLDEKEVKILDDWEKLFARKYPVVAKLRESDE